MIGSLMTAEEQERFRDLILAGMVATLAERCDAAIVNDGPADDLVEQLLAEGWTLAEGEEMIGGKRVRIMRMP